jgi:small subunit ribosomal protein S6
MEIIRDYSVIFILLPTLEDEAIDKEIAKYEEIVTKNKGTIEKIDKWGRRDIATIFNKHSRGFYVEMIISSNAKVLDGLRHGFKINDKIIRNIITKIDKKVAVSG